MATKLHLEKIEQLADISNYKAVVSIRINSYYRPLAYFHNLLGKCVNLEELYIERGADLWELPDCIYGLSKLQTLSLSNCHIKRISPQIAKLENLKTLQIHKCPPFDLPNQIGYLTKLETLDLSNTKLKNELDGVDELTALKHLNLYQTGLKKLCLDLEKCTIQELILSKTLGSSLTKRYPEFKKQLRYFFENSPLEKKYLFALIRLCNKNNYTPIFRAVLMNLLADNDDKLEELAGMNHILEATDVKTMEVIRLKALKYYEHRWGKGYQKTLQANSNITVAGKLSQNKNELQKKLKTQQIAYSAKLTKKTTHLLLGQLSHGVYKEASNQNIPIVTEQMVLTFINNNTEQFLVDDQEARPETSQNISNLLLSGQDENILLALELFKHGGFPKELLTELFIAYKQTQEPKIAHELDRLIRQYGSVSLIDLTKKNSTLFSSYTSEISLRTTLNHIKKNTTLDVLKIAWHGYRRYNNGLNFLLSNLPSEEVTQLLKDLTDNNKLALLKLRLTSVPKEVFGLTELTSLDLSSNNLQTISIPSLKKLKKLTHLNLKWNRQLQQKKDKIIKEIKSASPNLNIEI